MLIGDILRQTSARYPKKTAMVFKERKETYEQLNARVNSLANGLLNMGFKKGDSIAILSRNCPEFLEFYLAIAKAGLTAVPLNYRLTKQDLTTIINDSQGAGLVVHEEYGDIVRAISPNLKTVKHYISIGSKMSFTYDIEALIKENQTNEPKTMINEEDCWLIGYTSGTTGKAKGVITSQKNTVFGTISTALEMQIVPSDICLLVVPFCFAAASTTRFHGLLRGCTNVITNFEPESVMQLIETERVTITTMGPSMVQEIVNHPKGSHYNLKSMRKLGITTGPVTPELWEKLDRLFGPVGVPFYGQTETCFVGLTMQREEMEEDKHRILSVGKAGITAEVRIVNFEGKDVRHNREEVGEVIVRGDSVFHGYWNLPDETTETIRDGWVYTGDLATIDEDGYVYLVGRKSEMIRSGGLKVMPKEIEDVITKHPAVLRVAVIGIPNDKWGETPHAVIMLKEGERVTEGEIMELCKRNLASFKKPSSIEFVDELPLTVSGKVIKRELKEKYWKDLSRRIH